VNRTERLYALVEELRACAPRRRSARELASLYEVSARTIERDIGALQQAGVPIYADTGRAGGYTVDKSLTLPPLNFAAAEAVAVAVALAAARYLRRHLDAAAMMRCFGAPQRQILGIFVIQFGVLGLCASAAGTSGGRHTDAPLFSAVLCRCTDRDRRG